MLAFRPTGSETVDDEIAASWSGCVTTVLTGGCELTAAGWLLEPMTEASFGENGRFSQPVAAYGADESALAPPSCAVRGVVGSPCDSNVAANCPGLHVTGFRRPLMFRSMLRIRTGNPFRIVGNSPTVWTSTPRRLASRMRR